MLRRELPPGNGLMLLTGIGLEKRAEAGDEKYAEPSVFSRWALREWGSNYRMNANPETSWLEDGQKRGFFKFASDSEQPAKGRNTGLTKALQTGALTGGLLGAHGAHQGIAGVRRLALRDPAKYEEILRVPVAEGIKRGLTPAVARRAAVFGSKLSGGVLRGVPSAVGGFVGGAAGGLLLPKLRQRKQTGEVK